MLTMFLDDAASAALTEVLQSNSGYSLAGYLKADVANVSAIAYRKPRLRTYAEASAMHYRGLDPTVQAYQWYVFVEQNKDGYRLRLGFSLPDLDDPEGWQRFYAEFRNQLRLG